MLKKIIIASTLLLVNTAFAFTLYGGTPYVGAQTGILYNLFQFNDGFANSYTPGSQSIPYGVFVGIGGAISKYIYINGEGFLNGNTQIQARTTTLDGSNNGQVELSSRYNYGGSILPGLIFNNNNTQVYLRLGFVRTNFYYTINVNSYVANNTTQTGFQSGIGIKTKLTSINSHLELRGDYIYTNSLAFNTENFVNNNTGGSAITSYHINPTLGQFTIGVDYNFG
ncbi:MAG TPA: hypothetical protein VJL60_01255 [Gammaproteobacteria bacterium]|nr:hypothetical protein [Gammaproteobacteria bacterium]